MKNITKEELSRLKLLIVDDAPNNVLLLKSIFKNEGYQLDVANGGSEALEKVEKWHPDIILLDVMMPDVDGFRVAEVIRSNPQNENVAIIFVTALHSAERVVKGFESGGDDYVVKPINNREVILRVKQQATIILSRRKIVKQSEALERSMKWRDRLYSVVAHDLRDPLGSARMLLTMALDELESKGEGDYESLQMASDAVDNTFYLLDNLLKWAKTQVGDTVVVAKSFSMDRVVKQNIELLKPTCANKDVSIDFDDRAEETLVFADYDMINTIVRNLLGNAIKFSHPGSKIDVKITNDAESSTISIKDYGVGISSKHTHLILDDNSDFSTVGTNREAGHGLGLLLCKYFVELNDGTITFKSAEGEGTEFFVTLPLSRSNI